MFVQIVYNLVLGECIYFGHSIIGHIYSNFWPEDTITPQNLNHNLVVEEKRMYTRFCGILINIRLFFSIICYISMRFMVFIKFTKGKHTSYIVFTFFPMLIFCTFKQNFGYLRDQPWENCASMPSCQWENDIEWYKYIEVSTTQGFIGGAVRARKQNQLS